MVILGLILVLVALLLGAALITGASAPGTVSQDVEIHVGALSLNLNPLTLVIAGMAVMFLLWLGLVLIKVTLARKARLRRERKSAEREARERREREEAEATERARHEEGERQLEERRVEQERRQTDETTAIPRESTRPITREPGDRGL